jgi:hypothetical protein
MCYIVYAYDCTRPDLLQAVLYYDDFATVDDFAAALAALGRVRLESRNLVSMAFNDCFVPPACYPKRWQDVAELRGFGSAFANALAGAVTAVTF